MLKPLNTTAAMALVILTAGCAHYYKVTDLATGKEYFTQEVSRSGSAVVFKDERTGGQTTLQNSQFLEIKKDAYQAGVKAPAAPAAPAAAAPGTPANQ